MAHQTPPSPPSPPSQKDGAPVVFHASHRRALWRTLYIWVWVLTFVALVGVWVGLEFLPLQEERASSSRPQVSVRVDRLLAILQGKAFVLGGEAGEAAIPTMAQHLLENTRLYGLLPQRGQGDAPWRHYRTLVKVKPGGAKLAIIVSELGLSRTATERAVDLPSAVTLAFSPYADDLGRWALFAREKGHELLLVLPVEAPVRAAIDAGSMKMSAAYDRVENEQNLKRVLGRMTGYVGLIAANDTTMFQDRKSLQLLVDDLSKRGLIFIDPRATRTNDQLFAAARRRALPLARVNTVLEQPYAREEIDRHFEAIDKRLRRDSRAVIVRVAPYPATLEALAAWLQRLPSYAQVLPISALFSAKSGRERKF